MIKILFRNITSIIVNAILIVIIIGLGVSLIMINKNTKIKYREEERGNVSGLFNVTNLPNIEKTSLSYMQSSFDRSGDNADASGFLYQEDNKKVFLEVDGPGVVNRIWMTGFSSGVDRIYIYVDGKLVVDLSLTKFFAAETEPFTSPLVADETISSGGYISYVPIYFNNHIKICGNGSHYYAMEYEIFSPDVKVNSFSSNEDYLYAQQLWNNVGSNPSGNPKIVKELSNISINNNDRYEYTIDGKNTITGIKLKIDGVKELDVAKITDNGRSHIGTSKFTLSINPSNEGVKLTRRMYYAVANQRANIYVDGEFVGEWYNASFDPSYRWRDCDFNIPAIFTAGKSKINITVVSTAGSSIPWSEYYYWVYIKQSGNYILTDELDVGREESEVSHAYSIINYTDHSTKTCMYPPSSEESHEDLLNNIWIKIYWDDSNIAAVDCPIGMFFGSGCYGLQRQYKTLMLGISNGEFYCYYPMPFEEKARIVLENKSGELIKCDLKIETDDNLYTGDYGYFHTQYNIQYGAEDDGQDMVLLNVLGSGSLVGILYCPESNNIYRSYFEGDERFYIDGSLTPQIYGTGMEDFFNGGWGFKFDQYSIAVSAFSSHSKIDTLDRTSQLRLFLTDKVNFKTGIICGIEHGNRNLIETSMKSLAYFYLSDASMELTDSLNIGDKEDEKKHNYTVDGIIYEGTSHYYYEGMQDRKVVIDSGVTFDGYSKMKFDINKANDGVILKRRIDYSISSQKAKVYVDGIYVGNWLTAGNNPETEWKDVWFIIPAQYTKGKAEIEIKIEFVSSGSDEWSEYRYDVYSIIK